MTVTDIDNIDCSRCCLKRGTPINKKAPTITSKIRMTESVPEYYKGSVQNQNKTKRFLTTLKNSRFLLKTPAKPRAETRVVKSPNPKRMYATRSPSLLRSDLRPIVRPIIIPINPNS
jgi:hypothetical protein